MAELSGYDKDCLAFYRKCLPVTGQESLTWSTRPCVIWPLPPPPVSLPATDSLVLSTSVNSGQLLAAQRGYKNGDKWLCISMVCKASEFHVFLGHRPFRMTALPAPIFVGFSFLCPASLFPRDWGPVSFISLTPSSSNPPFRKGAQINHCISFQLRPLSWTRTLSSEPYF